MHFPGQPTHHLLNYRLKSEDNSLEKTIFHFLFLPSLSTVLKEILSKPEVYSKPSRTSKGRFIYDVHEIFPFFKIPDPLFIYFRNSSTSFTHHILNLFIESGSSDRNQLTWQLLLCHTSESKLMTIHSGFTGKINTTNRTYAIVQVFYVLSIIIIR